MESKKERWFCVGCRLSGPVAPYVHNVGCPRRFDTQSERRPLPAPVPLFGAGLPGSR